MQKQNARKQDAVLAAICAAVATAAPLFAPELVFLLVPVLVVGAVCGVIAFVSPIKGLRMVTYAAICFLLGPEAIIWLDKVTPGLWFCLAIPVMGLWLGLLDYLAGYYTFRVENKESKK